MTKPLKVAVIGTGFIGPVHVEAVRRLGGIEVAAIVGSSQESAQRVAEQLGIPKAYGDYRYILDDETIDVVHNCTPNYLHYEITRQLIEKGKHVFSEKPLAMTSEECKSLVDLATAHHIVHGVNFNYRTYPVIQHLRSLVRDGSLGNIFLVHGSYLQDWLLNVIDYNWRLEPDKGGKTRAIADIGSHWVDLIQHVTGQRIIRVMADFTTVHPVRKKPLGSTTTFQSNSTEHAYEEVAVGSEDFASVMFEMDGGIKGTMLVSQVSAGRKNRLSFEISGANSSAAWNQEEPERLWIGHRDKPNELLLADPSLLHPDAAPFIHYPGGHNEAWADGVKSTMQEFYRFIREGKQPGIDQPSFATFDDGYQISRVADAIFQSNASRSWVDISSREGE